MLDNYSEKNNNLYFAAIGCAIASVFITLFFLTYLDLQELAFIAVPIVPLFVFSAIINSDHRTRS